MVRTPEILGSAEVLDQMPVGIFVTDDAGACLHVNRRLSELTGCPREEALGDGWMSALHPSDRDEIVQEWEDAAAEGRSFHLEYRFRRPDGSVVWVLGHADRLRDASGDADGFLGTLVDITERKHAEKRRNELISVVSHEIRGPLASIHGALTYLEAGDYDSEEQAEKLREMALRNSGFLAHLVDDLLVYERLRARRMNLLVETVPLREIAVQAAEMSVMRADAAPSRVKMEVGEGSLRGDRRRLIQVVANLVGNALKFSAATDPVTVRGEVDDVWSTVSVQDQGRGIPPDRLDDIFLPFEQVNAEDRNRMAGAGLGLAICRAIVERHGGRIDVESEVGRGSTFTVTLPTAGPPDEDGD